MVLFAFLNFYLSHICLKFIEVTAEKHLWINEGKQSQKSFNNSLLHAIRLDDTLL